MILRTDVMGRRRSYGPTRRTYLVVIAAATVAALVLPAKWTGKLISLVQVVVPFQHAASAAADSVERVLGSGGATASSEICQAVELRKAALERQVASLAIRITELEEEVDILTATRLWDVEGRHIGARGRLIPATVILEDLLSWRSSRLVNVGSLQGVRRGHPVASRSLVFEGADGDGVEDGMAILLGEVFVGLVEQEGTHTARVRLLSDVGIEMKVRIGRLTDEGFTPLDGYFWLVGRGSGVMEIHNAKRRDVEAGLIQVGDMVLSDPTRHDLPTAMAIGRIAAIVADRDNPLLSILTVESDIDEASLRRVYVFTPDTGVDGGSEAAKP